MPKPAPKHTGPKFKVMCKTCKKFYLVYPKHNMLCPDCRARWLKAWMARDSKDIKDTKY